jgi:TRAP-type mannitol/chloroaromatic compound transport system permease small subunit
LKFSESRLGTVVFWFAVGMIINACAELYVWFAFNYFVPGWVPASTWLGTSIIILAYFSSSSDKKKHISNDN